MKRLIALLVVVGGCIQFPPDPAADAGELDAAAVDADGASKPETAIAVDAGSDVHLVEAASEAKVEAAPTPGPEPEPPPPVVDAGAGDTREASAPVVDAGPATVCDGRAPSPTLDCTATSATCTTVRTAIQHIHEQFPKPCDCDSPNKCGGVVNGNVTETLPMTCRNGAWTLAGSQLGDSWVPWFECMHGCPSGKICDP